MRVYAEQKLKKLSQIILWTLALVVVFAVATIFGWKVFYGVVVPQANNIAAFSTLGLFAFAALAGIMVNFGPCSLAVLPAFRKMIGKTEMMKKIAGRVLILTSIYMLGIFIFLGM